MEKQHKPRFLQSLEALAELYQRELSAAAIEMWWRAMAHIPVAAFEAAVAKAAITCDRFPLPVKIRELAGEMAAGERAVMAWAAMRRAARTHGSYRSIDFDDPLINATVRNMGGWIQICATDEKDFDVWGRKEFERIYKALMTSGVSEEAARPLVGTHELNNEGVDWGGRLLSDGPVKVKTALPPHYRPVVRQLSAPERLALSEKQTGDVGDNVRAIIGKVAEKVSA